MIVPEFFHRINDSVCFLLGVPLNAFLVWLIVNRSLEEMRQYRSVLLLSTIIDIVYLTDFVVVMPVLGVKDGLGGMISLGPFGSLPNPWSFAVLMTWAFIAGFSLFSLAVPFVYRYYVICRGNHWGLGVFLTMLLVPAALSLGQMSLQYSFGYTRCEEQNIAGNAHFGFPADSDKTYMMPYFTETPEGASYVSYSLFLCSGANYVLIVIFGRRIYRHLNAMAAPHLSQERVRALNKQISTTLIIQSVIPLVVEFVPTTVLVSSTLLGINFDNSTLYTTAAYAWIPVLNPLVTMWVVRAYRREIWGVFSKFAAIESIGLPTMPGSRVAPIAPPQIAINVIRD